MNILIVDDHDVIRQSLEMIIQSEFPHTTCTKLENAQSCTAVFEKDKFDLLILDINLPDMDGTILTEWVLKIDPTQKILIFSMNPTAVFAKRLYQMGIRGFLSKQASVPEIRKALYLVLAEDAYYMSDEFKTMLNYDLLNKNTGNLPDKLSKRELSIAQMLANGKSIEEIANLLQIEPSTIRTYKGRVFQKMEVTTMHEFLAKANLYKII